MEKLIDKNSAENPLGAGDLINISFKELLALLSDKTPDSVFIKYSGKGYTWLEIEKLSHVIADDLSAMGVKKGTHVGLCGMNSINWVFTFFAIQKLGAVACLLNFNYNQAEIASVSAIGDITYLCCGDTAADIDCDALINADDIKITHIYKIGSDISYEKRIAEYDGIKDKYREKVESDDVCVMIYTSGSTGKPKGVLLSAYNIINAANSRGRAILQDKDDVLCLILPLFHIFGMTSGFISNAIYGSRIVIPTDNKTDTLLDVIEKEGCTLFHAVPTMALAIINNKNFSPERVKTLRCTILSGGATTKAQMEKMTSTLSNIHFMSSYGLSEISPVSITDYNDTMKHLTATVGKPLPHIEVKIVSRADGTDLPAGKEGEIYIKGFNLMCGYYKRQIEDQAINGEGWLQTGDLGFLDEEGYLHISGRAKELIIRGGENIMPNEVASAISACDDIADVKVVGVPDDFYGEAVCACVVMRDGREFSEDALRAFLADKIAKYKIPAHYIVLTDLPKLANGKPDMVNIKANAVKEIQSRNAMRH